MTSRADSRRQQGSVSLGVFAMIVLVAGLMAALTSTCRTHERAAAESMDREFAYRCAESGAAYYAARLVDDGDYFLSNPPPLGPTVIGDGAFTLESVTDVGNDQYEISLTGAWGESTYRLGVILGAGTVAIPPGVQVTGTGNDTDLVLDLDATTIASYDPATGFDPSAPRNNTEILVSGSARLAGGTEVGGNITATGTTTIASGTVNGSWTDGSDPLPVPDIDPYVQSLLDESKTANDNNRLGTIFGTQWQPLAGAENYGDLIVNGGDYVIPAGTYRFRRLEIRSGATVTFDTRTAPAELIYVGSGRGTGTGNDLILDSSARLRVDNGLTDNGLTAVLAEDCDFKMNQGAIFGQSITDPNNAGYTQIISLGGNSSSDDIVLSNGSKVYGRLYAAAHELTVDGEWYGSALAKRVTLRGGSLFAFDEGTLGTTIPVPGTSGFLARFSGGYETP